MVGLISTRREQPAVPLVATRRGKRGEFIAVPPLGDFCGRQLPGSGKPTSASDMVSPPAAELSIEKLCWKYHNEDAHSAHVTRLALQLFDETRSLLHLAPTNRPLLKAACRLHDVGYGADPRRHRDKSAEIILQESLTDFSDADRAIIAATVLFHSGDVNVTRQQPLVARLPDPQLARRLGSFLRIADGLDYGHLQDAVIVGVRVNGNTVLVEVDSPLFQYNLERARQKADLWRAIFPLDIQFVPAPLAQSEPSLLAPDLHILEAARRLIMLQFKMVAMNVDGALRNEDPEPLHDIRIAIRRLRAALWAFRKPLANTSAHEINFELQRLNEALGPARDADMWIGFLTGAAFQRRCNHPNRRWAAFMNHQTEHRRRQQTTTRRVLSGPSFASLSLKLGRLARLEIPRLMKTTPSDNLAKFAQRALGKKLRRALKLAKLRHSDSSTEVHQFRKALRKARYLGEFFAPALGPPFDKLTRRIHAAERAIGKMHDADVGLTLAVREGLPPPRLLLQHLAQSRYDQLIKVDKEWRRLRQFMSKHAAIF
jgi:CHAD domain-containing protein